MKRQLDVAALQEQANLSRRRDIKMIARAGLGHLGGDMSVMDILTTLYFAVLNVDPGNPAWPQRDRLILSKGHCAGALYCTLAARGFFPLEKLETFVQPLSDLNGHPNRLKVPGVEANTGALGHGLPVGVGAALAAKMDAASWRAFVITGDGELQEGSNWEAAMAASHYKLDNLTWIIDRNRFQQGNATETTNRLEPLRAKLIAFGWSVREVDGHGIPALLAAFARLPFEAGRPNCIIAHTHKGQPISFMLDQAGWHHRVPSPDQLARALKELGEVVE